MSDSLRIMIVEDEAITAWAIEEALMNADFTVCGKATDYESAVKTMKAEWPDLVLVDITLPGQIDGITTAQELTQIKWLPFIYLTGNTENDAFARAKKTSPAAFLHKPFRPLDLARQIDLAISNFYQAGVPQGAALSNDLFVWDGKGYGRVRAEDILFVKADGGYSQVFLHKISPGKSRSDKPITLSVPFGNLIRHLPADNFLRIGRSKCVNIAQIDRIESGQIFVGGYEVDLPNGSYKLLLERLNIVKSRK